jgi:hypothetical protein
MSTTRFVFALLLALALTSFVAAQKQRITCAHNIIQDNAFADGYDLHYLCRNTTAALANDDVRFCTVGYNLDIADYPAPGPNGTIPWWTGTPNSLVNLTCPFGRFSDYWTLTSGTINMVTSNFQNLASGDWAVGLNGQFGVGVIQQSFTPGSTNAANMYNCSYSFARQTNRLAEVYAPFVANNNYQYQSTYQWQVLEASTMTVVPGLVFTGSAPPFSSNATVQSEVTTFSLPGGSYIIEMASTDDDTVNGLPFTVDSLFYEYTGAIIDDICMTCNLVASPSPSMSPSPSASPSMSSSASPSMNPSRSPSPSMSPSPAPSMSPSPAPAAEVCVCPVCRVCPPPPPPESCPDTNINFDFANILRGA